MFKKFVLFIELVYLDVTSDSDLAGLASLCPSQAHSRAHLQCVCGTWVSSKESFL